MTQASSIRYGDTVIQFRIERAPRPSPRVLVHVEPDGQVVVQALGDASASDVVAVVRRRARWIHARLQALGECQSLLAPREWVSGECHRYLGRRYLLKVIVDPTAAESVKLAGGQLQVRVVQPGADRVRELVRRWYDARAAAWLKARVTELAERLPWVRVPPPVALRRMKGRWGSCSPAGRLTLNPVLIRAPRDAVDYVITHELCHLRHHNHGRDFYMLLGRYVPGWQAVKQRLDAMANEFFAEQG